MGTVKKVKKINRNYMGKNAGNEKWQALSNKKGNDIIKNLTNEGVSELVKAFILQLIRDALTTSKREEDYKAQQEVTWTIKNSILLDGIDRGALLSHIEYLKNEREKRYVK